MSIEILTPHLVTKVWGGEKLAKLKGLFDKKDILPLGETWEVSRHSDGPSSIENGQSLENNLSFEELPYLVKFIDTTDNLSIQVHPDDEYARRVEKSSGKTECWLILENEPGAGIYLGLKEGVDQKQLQECLDKKEDLSQLMVFYSVERGDFFFVPAGSIHAIGKGVTLAEIQQSSGITYRVWDWNRVGLDGKPRELHVDKALDVINFSSEDNRSETFRVRKNIFQEKKGELISHRDFHVNFYCLDENESLKISGENKSRRGSLMCLQGGLQVKDNKDKNNKDKKVNAYQCALLPKGEEVELISLKSTDSKGEDLSQKTIVLHIS